MPDAPARASSYHLVPLGQIAENSPEHIAYKMIRDVFLLENKTFDNLTRDEFLDTFDECLEAVKGFCNRKVSATN